jgi:hypothetical protein
MEFMFTSPSSAIFLLSLRKAKAIKRWLLIRTSSSVPSDFKCRVADELELNQRFAEFLWFSLPNLHSTFVSNHQLPLPCAMALTENHITTRVLWLPPCPLLVTNSVALIRKRTIPTKRLPLVGKVSANFCR